MYRKRNIFILALQFHTFFIPLFILFCITFARCLSFLRRKKQQQRQQQRALMHLSAFFAWADVFPTPITIFAKVSQLFCLVRVAKSVSEISFCAYNTKKKNKYIQRYSPSKHFYSQKWPHRSYELLRFRWL